MEMALRSNLLESELRRVSRVGPAAALIPSDPTASATNKIARTLTLPRICTNHSKTGKQGRRDQSSPPEQYRASAIVQKIEVGGEQPQHRKANDIQSEHRCGHCKSDHHILTVDADPE